MHYTIINLRVLIQKSSLYNTKLSKETTTMQEALHETKTHGKLSFPYIIYRGNIPEYLHAYPLHWHDEMEIIYNQKGSGIVHVHSQRYILQTGDLIILPPQYIHSIEQYGKNDMSYFNILFHFSLLSSSHYDYCYEKYFVPLSEHLRTFPIYIPQQTSLSKKLRPHITYLIENRKHCYLDDELMVKSHLFAILHHLMKHSTPSSDSDTTLRLSYEQLKPILLYVKEHYPEAISIETAAKLCGFSSSHFMKRFKSLTGKSFTQYLISYRLEVAANKLIETNQKIIEIGEEVGFNHPSYFTRAFYQKYGVSPLQYREQSKHTNNL